MKLLKSFKYALKGLAIATKEEQNFRIHLVAIVCTVVCGALLKLSVTEWTIIVLTMGTVLTAELFNTAIEDIVNFISPEYNKAAGRIKDISAAAVMISAITALLVGVYIFGSKIFG